MRKTSVRLVISVLVTGILILSYNIASGAGTIGDTGNIDSSQKDYTSGTFNVSGGVIRFITIGDTHVTVDISASKYKWLTDTISYINSRTDVDFVVELGDLVSNSNAEPNFVAAKSILGGLNKPYYVVEGNHDRAQGGAFFRKYFGPSEHMDNVNGYQLIFVGIQNSSTLNWSFDFSQADKNKPTIIFSHGPVQPDIGKDSCQGSWKDGLHRYACSMKSEVDKFTNLLGFYDGHVHVGTSQIINNTLYVTEYNIGGGGSESVYIGYTVIQNGVVNHKLLLPDPKGNMFLYYRGLGQNANILETGDLLKAADDWRNNIIPPGFSLSITTGQLLALADEWRNY